MKLETLLFPIIVFLGGCCFGPSGSTIKLAYAEGYNTSDVIMSQYFFGWLCMLFILGMYLVIKVMRGKFHRPKRPTIKTVILLVVAGITTALTTTFYMLALQSAPAYISVILLFQYTWMGIIIEAIHTRKLPRIYMVISLVILIVASFLAVGVGTGAEYLDWKGILFGLLSAVAYSVYITILGKIDSSYSPITRSFLVLSIALAALTLILSPSYYVSGIILEGGLWRYGLIIGIIGCAMPSFLFSIGTPKLSAGAATILSSSELPASIICSVIILSEAVSWLQWIGVVLMFFGIAFPYLWEYTAKKRREKISPHRYMPGGSS